MRDFYEQTAGVGASAALVKATLINAAVDLPDENNDGIDDNAYPIPNNHEGWGRVDLAGATDGSHLFVDEPNGLTTGASQTFAYAVSGGSPSFKATLVWTDYPSATSVTTNLVNDLDLQLIAPDGTVYLGNVFSGGWSETGGVADRINNVENVYVAAPQPGIWTVEVDAFNVPQGPQPFALVVDGGSLDGVPPAITSPVAGTTLTGATVSFQWTANETPVTAWQLDVGTGPGGTDYYSSGVLSGAARSATATGLPTAGQPVFARLSFEADGVWDFVDAQYTAVTIGPPAITSPPPGSVLSGTTVTFQWTANGTLVSDWQLDVGSALGAVDLYSSAVLGAGTLSDTANGLPTGGQPVFVRLRFTADGVPQVADFNYTAAPGVPTITSPAPGSVLPGATATFTWTANGTQVSDWQLDVGSSFGGADFYSSGILAAGTLSDTATGLPIAGQAVYVRLRHTAGGVAQYADFQYTGATLTPPAITSPPPGSVLSGATVTFQWTPHDTPVDDWQLDVGSSVGGADFYTSGILASATLSDTATGLPIAGQAVHVRLRYTTGGVAQYADFQYTGATLTPPAITSPPPGSVLSGATATFQWTPHATPVDDWQLDVGSSVGGADFYTSGILASATLSDTATGLPTAGQAVHVRLRYTTGGVAQYADVQYTGATLTPPAITSPAPGSVLPGATVTFEWTPHATPVDDWRLDVGSSVGGADFYTSGVLASGTLSDTATGLPTAGQAVHVRLRYTTGGVQYWLDFVYTSFTASPPAITSPVPGSVLPGATVTFTWTDNGTAVSNWQLDAGSYYGGSNFYSSGLLDGSILSDTATGLPTTGQPVFVRLRYTTGGVQYWLDFVYTSFTASPPAITSPVPGSVLPGATVTFTWTDNGTAVSSWQLDAGYYYGGSNFYSSGLLDGSILSETATGLPTTGQPVFVRLRYTTGGVQYWLDFVYISFTASPPTITSPTPGSVLPGAAATFTWTDNGTAVSNWQLDVGSYYGAADFYSSGLLDGGTLADTATGLPTTGQPVFVRLRYTSGGVVYWVDFVYMTAT